jgi:hypothetical protein
MFMSMWLRILSIGLLLWAAGTAAIRLAGRRLLQSNHSLQTAELYLISFVLMAFFVPRICRRLGIEKERWPAAASLMILPTLVLDPFSCVFFTSVFPNVDPAAAGVFGGWMLICCAGGVAGTWQKR